jgi:hypothetical protein
VGANGWLEAAVVAPPALRAGDGADLTLELHSTSSSVEGVDVAVHGLAGAHLGLPAGRVVLRPGVRRHLPVRLQLPTSATPGDHQLVLELRRQLDPDDTLLVPFALEVLAAPVPVVSLRRSTIRRRGRVRVENPNDEPIRVALTGSVNGAAFRFDPTVLDLAPGASGRARLRVVSKGRFGRRPATVGAATANAAASVDAVVVGRSRSWPFLATFVALAAFVGAVAWAANDAPRATEGATASSLADDPAGSVPGDDRGGAGATSGTGSTAVGGSVAGAGQEAATSSGPGATTPPSTVGSGGGAVVGSPQVEPDCAAPGGPTGWALRGRVLSDVVAAVVARPAGMPVEFATTTLTDDAGMFTICPLELGDYLVTVLSEGYYPLVLPAHLAGASTDLGELALEAGAASLIGLVTGPSGPVEGATVVVRDGRREVSRTTTDATGEYLVIGVPTPADVVVEVSAPGLAPTFFTSEVLTDGRVRQPETRLVPG